MAFDTWIIGATANAIISASYFTIAGVIFSGLLRTRQVTLNVIATATGAIFLTCAFGHGIHFLHTMFPLIGHDVDVGYGARASIGEWHMWLADGVTAIVGLWYLSLRTRLPALTRSALMFEDVRAREQQALEIHDNVVQALTRAKLALEMGRNRESITAMEESLSASRAIIDDVLRSIGSKGLSPGDLRRRTPPPPGDSP